ncbi:MAG: hypothetical protein ACTHK2_10695 [Dokdonella sp.]|uniref:hypothetical protein n=1 Tax=Dokdonella sp. TaxID=2291710 RepID=UPI003F7EE1AD
MDTSTDDRRAERSHARWTWTIAGVLIVVLFVLWTLDRGPAGAGACCAVSAIPASAADAERASSAEAPAANPR